MLDTNNVGLKATVWMRMSFYIRGLKRVLFGLLSLIVLGLVVTTLRTTFCHSVIAGNRCNEISIHEIQYVLIRLLLIIGLSINTC